MSAADNDEGWPKAGDDTDAADGMDAAGVGAASFSSCMMGIALVVMGGR